MLNLKIPITKVTRVSFRTPTDYMLQNLKMIYYQSDLENPNSATNDRITFHLFLYPKPVSPIVLHLTIIDPLKSYGTYFLFQLNCSFGFSNIQFLGESYKIEKRLIMTS